jgi:hypothetical protein
MDTPIPNAMDTPIPNAMDTPITTTDPLLSTLLDVLYELQNQNIPLLLGGGYGLYLKQQQIQASNAPTLLAILPDLRITNDLDLFLKTEILADSARLQPLRTALDKLGFMVIPSAQNYQFARKFTQWGQEWDVKIDLLTRTPDLVTYPHLKVDARRVKPYPSVGLHAHRTDEAVAIEEEAQEIIVTGIRTSGELYTGRLYLPQTYPFLMMKLFALRDQIGNMTKGRGEKHALDLYTLIGLLTEEEYERTLRLRNRFQETPEGKAAREVVASLFATMESEGTIRLRQNPNAHPQMDTAGFLNILQEIFQKE